MLGLVQAVEGEPRHIYLTWDQPDTAHTQTVVFQTLDRASNPRLELAQADATARAISASTRMVSGLTRRVHQVTLQDLEAATTYRFRVGDDRYGMSSWREFRTLPEDDSPLVVASGGDMYRHPETVRLLHAVSQFRPAVALVGGDIAYADGRLNRVQFWDDWFDNWESYLNPKQGPMVPMVCAIGNHEVRGGFGRRKQDAPFFFSFFPQGGKPYFVRRLGSEMEVVVLDSGHVTTQESQRPFLRQALESMQQRQLPFRLALYHVPCYPTHRDFEDRHSALGRKHWVPLFDEFQLTAGLENHDHTFKRTHPLRGNKIDQEGTVYLGDGCWGRPPRSVAGKRWYQARASATRHVWVLTKNGQELVGEAINEAGEVFDRVKLPRRSRSANPIEAESPE